jgi:hypothetical protein
MVFMVFMLFWVFTSVLWAVTTVSGQVVIPDSDMGWKPDLNGMKVRVEGTEISADVDGHTGEFTITDVPTGAVTLLLVEDGQDVFTESSKRVQVEVGSEPVTGVSFNLVYHWKELAGYPPYWGETGYGEWTPHFVSDQVGFIVFRVRGEGIDPERMEMYRTLDAGNTWEEILHLEDGGQYYWCEPFYFSDQNYGVAQISVDTDPGPNTYYIPKGVLRTLNGGATWSYVDFPNPPDEEASSEINIHRFAQIDNNHWIVAGLNRGKRPYGFPHFDVIWESTDAGATWEVKIWWEQDYGECTGLGANSEGKAIAFFTPYFVGGERRYAIRDTSGNWAVTGDGRIVTNSGYGPADVPMVDDTAWVANSNQGSLPQGLYQSNDAGQSWATNDQSWTKISDVGVQYMDFGSLDKGFGLFGGKARISYDGGKTWLHQSNGGGLCCHLNNIWAFDTTHAIWHEGGDGDPNGKGQIFTYVDPWEANFELLSGVSIKDAYVGPGAVNVPMGSYKLFNHGPVPIVVNALDLSASGSGDDKADVSGVNLWLDENANGYKDDSDTFLDSGAYANDNGSAHFFFSNILLKPHVPVYLLVTYDFGNNLIPGKTYFCFVKAEDIQAEIQGTGTPISPTAPLDYPLVTRQMTAGKTIFSDNFESGLDRWTPDLACYPWQLTENASVSPIHSVYVWDDREHDPYGGNNCLTLNQSLTLSEDGNYYLTFWHNYRLDPSFILWVEVSTDGGANWNWVGRYGSYDHWDNYSTGDFVQEVLDLDDYTGQAQVLLRFRFDWTAGWYYYGNWYLDDIKVFHIPAPAPVADFTADPTAGTAPLTVNFTDFSTGDITSWEWNFGDSGTSTAQDPSHIYNTTGAYTVSLTVTGPGGTDTETKIDYITVSTEDRSRRNRYRDQD